MREIKFRGRIHQGLENAGHWIYWGINGTDMLDALDRETIGEFTGLLDKNGKEIYTSDICQFSNGDKFIVKSEEWLEIYGEWIGEPECEDQLRDTYRMSNAEIIGNEHENPELLEEGA
jgi:uncharacterized phage protein (TIGR01671 family)